MRSHGWSGRTPTSDEEAVNRILDAVDSLIAEGGSSIRVSDLARTLGVSRQTIYRYFPGAEALVVGSQMRAANGFLDRLADHLRGWTNPAAAVVEGVAFAAEEFADDPLMARVLDARLPGGTSASFTAGAAFGLGREMFRRYDVDWAAHGFDHAAMDDLIELAVRTLQSILLDPPERPLNPVALRSLLSRWLGPAVLYHQLSRDIDALTALTQASQPAPGPRESVKLA
ncbi:TetR family transcriptional regulator [Mycobacterium mantenii]|uniref:TetR family transcriptional regulator n=1 Tax=Mycobacterium mantenii TaxID=560555 RepID=UPI0007FB795F|nr:TetR family transcriptional regulator [Mycobacterium mantenii]OBH54432.1 TetR family transcriptional regulator [Mycobacterium mantenii]OBH80046.1 TetR family transcriptional regulator [Mycobacterium mantenii]